MKKLLLSLALLSALGACDDGVDQVGNAAGGNMAECRGASCQYDDGTQK